MPLIEDVALANRILARHGVLDAFGHVSARDADDPNRFLLARNMAPALVTADDVMTLALDGTVVGADDRRPYLERFIHGSIYRARPDVGAVVHSHAASIVPFGVVRDAVFRPVFHMASFLGSAVPVFEIRDAAGPENDLLVRDERLGDALARALGDATMVLMRGHGATVVGRTLQDAVFRAVYAEANARVLIDALRLGAVTYLSETEAALATESNAGQSGRAWELWRREADSR